MLLVLTMADSESSSPPEKSEQDEKPEQKGQPSKEEIKREIKKEIAEAISGSSEKGGDKGGQKKEGQEGKKEDDQKKHFEWTPLKIIGLIIVGLIVIAVATYYIIYSIGHETTDDAYTTGFVHQISSRVTGNVTQLLIVDNQFVHQGQVLLQLDPTDYQSR